MRLINKDTIIREIDRRIVGFKEVLKTCDIDVTKTAINGLINSYESLKQFIDTIEVREVDLTDRRTDWSPSKKQKETVDFFSVHSREEVTEIDKRIEKKQKEYYAELRDKMMKAKDFPMTD